MKYAIAFVISLLIGFASALVFFVPSNVKVAEATVPPRAGQPHSDTFVIAGYGDLAPLNPITQRSKVSRTATYGLKVAAGCSLGSIADDLNLLSQQQSQSLGFSLLRNDSVNDFTVIVNCGNTQINLCGSVNIFCLPYGFPYKNDVSISDIIITYPQTSRLAILWHEIMGHAIATFNEQYCLDNDPSPVCAGSSQFAPAPNWQDIMNTGVDSRRTIADCPICIERWERVMYVISPNVQCLPEGQTGWDDCTGRWFMFDCCNRIISYEPSTGIWYNPEGRQEWLPCNQQGLRWNLLGAFYPPNNGSFVPTRGYWSFAPNC